MKRNKVRSPLVREATLGGGGGLCGGAEGIPRGEISQHLQLLPLISPFFNPQLMNSSCLQCYHSCPLGGVTSPTPPPNTHTDTHAHTRTCTRTCTAA